MTYATPKRPRRIKLVKLTDGEIVRVDLVDAGDNPEANVMFIKAKWTAAYINGLPDSSFAHIGAGGTKDDEGKTVPRSLRHLPYKDAAGKPDAAHVRNALARLSQVKGMSQSAMNAARRKLMAAAKEMGIEVTEKATPTTLAAAIEGREQQDKLDRLSWTFRDVVYNIVGSADLSPAEKVALLQTNLDQFKAMLSEIVGELELVVESGDETTVPEEMAKRAVTAVERAITEARKTMSAAVDDKDKGSAPAASALDINAIPEAQRAHVEAAMKRADEAEKRVKDAEAAAATEKARADAAEAEVTKLRPEDPWAGVSKAARERIEAQDAELTKLRNDREESEAVAKAREYATSDAEARKCGPIMLRVAKGRATADDVAEIERLLKSRREAMKLSGAFKAAGYDGSDNTAADDPRAELRKRARERVAKGDFKSISSATDHILATDSELAQRYNDSLRQGAGA